GPRVRIEDRVAGRSARHVHAAIAGGAAARQRKRICVAEVVLREEGQASPVVDGLDVSGLDVAESLPPRWIIADASQRRAHALERQRLQPFARERLGLGVPERHWRRIRAHCGEAQPSCKKARISRSERSPSPSPSSARPSPLSRRPSSAPNTCKRPLIAGVSTVAVRAADSKSDSPRTPSSGTYGCPSPSVSSKMRLAATRPRAPAP